MDEKIQRIYDIVNGKRVESMISKLITKFLQAIVNDLEVMDKNKDDVYFEWYSYIWTNYQYSGWFKCGTSWNTKALFVTKETMCEVQFNGRELYTDKNIWSGYKSCLYK